jgi:hypothetical protein
MFRWQTILGIGIGVVFAIIVLIAVDGADRGLPSSGQVFSECDGQLSELIIHYEPSAREVVAPAYRDFLGLLESDITVYVICPNRAAFDELAASIGRVHCKVVPIIVNHPMTSWSRDRWMALAPSVPDGPVTLWSPRGEAAASVWPARAGDQRVAADIAMALNPAVLSRRSSIYFDGGDFLADSRNVFVVPRVLQQNLQRTVERREDFIGMLAGELKRPVVLLDQAPDHHAGMFMMSAGDGVMLVGDPALGSKCIGEGQSSDFMQLPGGPDTTPETQNLFDAVARQCAGCGYRVVRIPLVPARDGRTFITYVNVIIDSRAGGRIVYLPFYRGAEFLNEAARDIWHDLGYEVRPVDCTSTFRSFGGLHCLVNVLKKTSISTAGK